MTVPTIATRHPTQPHPTEALMFRAKATGLQARRLFQNLLHPVKRHLPANHLKTAPVLAESLSRLWDGTVATAEISLQAGKIQNLRVALRELNGIEVPAGAVFSFWKQLGRLTQAKGYVAGRELREGCLIPSIGGGICQLSNALYDAALSAGFEIIERHAHSQVIPGSLAEVGRDATVFWNYVDLRFRTSQAFRIEAALTAEHLVVRLRGMQSTAAQLVQLNRKAKTVAPSGPNSCASCGVTSCFRNIERARDWSAFGRQAFLVDEYWPEFDAYLQQERTDQDLLLLPLNGKERGKSQYGWTTTGFGTIREHVWTVVERSLRMRSLAVQGAARQSLLLEMDRKLAQRFARSLTYDVTHVVVSQRLLPFLWMDGHLGGRTFDVLVTRSPLTDLHRQLDQARHNHPESPTLGDFRAVPELVEAEQAALQAAHKVITPHARLAERFAERGFLLPWNLPRAGQNPQAGHKIAFPAATVGRKGAYELRLIAQKLGLDLVLVGTELEGKDFWAGLQVERRSFQSCWLDEIGLVVLPAYVEHAPRRLLEAVAHGIPVIASDACGLGAMPGVMTIPAGDAEALEEAIVKCSF